MRRPKAEYRVRQVVVDRYDKSVFRIVKKNWNVDEGVWVYWDYRENGWHYEHELRRLNKAERGPE